MIDHIEKAYDAGVPTKSVELSPTEDPSRLFPPNKPNTIVKAYGFIIL